MNRITGVAPAVNTRGFNPGDYLICNSSPSDYGVQNMPPQPVEYPDVKPPELANYIPNGEVVDEFVNAAFMEKMNNL